MKTPLAFPFRGPSPVVGLVFSALGFLFVPGCTFPEAKPDPTQHFLLEASPLGEAPAEPGVASRPALGLRPVALAAYLRGPALVAVAGAEVRPVGPARWAEPLQEGVARVVREALLARGVARTVTVYPAPHDAVPDLELGIRIDACEGVRRPDGSWAARFVAEWSLRPTAAGATVLVSRRYAPQPAEWDGRDPAALAHALGAATSGLALEIAATLAK